MSGSVNAAPPAIAAQCRTLFGAAASSATANRKAQAMLDPKARNNKAVYPDLEDLNRGEFQSDVGDAIIVYEKYWEMLKTH